MDRGMTFVALVDAVEESVFGGKAVSLGAALRAGLPVPPGVALSASVVDAIAQGTWSIIAEAEHLPAGRLAVRSSAVGEDSSGASFAGQHVTKLNVRAAQIEEAVRAVWQSARCDAALAYRARKGLALEPRIGVVVQALVEPKAAGVLFTRHPITGANERLIEAAWGLGEAIVNGAVVPDRFCLDSSGRIIDVTPGCKDIKVWYDDEDGTVEVAVPAELQSVPCLSSSQLDALHDLANRCHRVWGADLDIEWALGADDTIYLLQCRPITTFNQAR